MCIVGIDTTVFINFLVWKEGFEKFLEALKRENKEVYGYEEEVRNKAIEWAQRINLVSYKDIPVDLYDRIAEKYPGLNEGEIILLAFLFIKKSKGRNCCFISDDESAREAGRREEFLPCCVSQYKVGGTIGILNFLYKVYEYEEEFIENVFKEMKSAGNYLPNKWNYNLDMCENW